MGMTGAMTADAAGQTERIRHFGSGGAALAYFDYERDARGDVLHIARLDGLTTYYDYDGVRRLTYENWKEPGAARCMGLRTSMILRATGLPARSSAWRRTGIIMTPMP